MVTLYTSCLMFGGFWRIGTYLYAPAHCSEGAKNICGDGDVHSYLGTMGFLRI